MHQKHGVIIRILDEQAVLEQKLDSATVKGKAEGRAEGMKLGEERGNTNFQY